MFSRLKKNIIDLVKEQQLKLGYRKEVVRLYYPAKTIKNLLGVECTIYEINKYLYDFIQTEEPVLGKIEYTCKNDRFCIRLPEKTSEYVHDNIREDEFIVKFINLIGKHECTIEEIISLFNSYSDDVHFEKMENKDFDYVIYFKDRKLDEYIYCLNQEGEHLIYHRFLPEDYEELWK